MFISLGAVQKFFVFTGVSFVWWSFLCILFVAGFMLCQSVYRKEYEVGTVSRYALCSARYALGSVGILAFTPVVCAVVPILTVCVIFLGVLSVGLSVASCVYAVKALKDNTEGVLRPSRFNVLCLVVGCFSVVCSVFTVVGVPVLAAVVFG